MLRFSRMVITTLTYAMFVLAAFSLFPQTVALAIQNSSLASVSAEAFFWKEFNSGRWRLPQNYSPEVVLVQQSSIYAVLWVGFINSSTGQVYQTPATPIPAIFQQNNTWLLAFPDESNYSLFLKQIPKGILSETVLDAHIPSRTNAAQAAISVVDAGFYPWRGSMSVTQGNLECKPSHCASNYDTYAWDFSNHTSGWEIYASRSGKIAYINTDHETNSGCPSCIWTTANVIVIDTGDGYATIYMHLAKESPRRFTVGDTVTVGQLIGYADSTGRTDGAHLHFALQGWNSSWNGVINPDDPKTATLWYQRSVQSLFTGESIGNPTKGGSPYISNIPFFVPSADVNALITTINTANSNLDATNISLSPGVFDLTAVENTTYGPTGLPIITSPITIFGNNTTIKRDSSAPAFRLLAVAAMGELSLHDVTLQGGYAPFTTSLDRISRLGGGIYNLGKLALYNAQIIDSTTGEMGSGGGIYHEGEVLSVNNTSFVNNRAWLGGGISAEKSATIIGGSFVNNAALITDQTSGGGAISACISHISSLRIKGTTFTNNTSGTSGGAIASCDMVTTTIEDSFFTDNSANTAGGAIYSAGRLDVHHSQFVTNSSNNGGAIYSTQLLNVDKVSEFFNNIASGHLGFGGEGGAIHHNQGSAEEKLVIEDSVFGNNHALRYGGGVREGGGASFEGAQITNSTFANNIAEGVSNPHGGNIYSESYSVFSIASSCIVGTSSEGVFMQDWNPDYPELDARDNWWSASNGPQSGMVSSNISFVPFLTSPNRGCPGNDSLVDAQPITSTSLLNASSSLASKVNDEPTSSCGTSVNKTLWYSFTSPSAGTLRVETNSGAFNPILSAWAGMVGNLTELGCNGGNTGLAPMAVTANGVQRIRLEVESGMKYYIMVGGDNDSGGDFTLATTFILPPPLNAAPSRNYYVTDMPTLTWNRVTWAIRYEVQIAKNQNFSNAATYPVDNDLSLIVPSPLANDTYYWRVRACSSAIKCGGWSAVDSFTIDVP